ncbi:P-loop containing nucleoside triphosphate hydrolase protein [Cercophora samala]|uniref:P-loop containing nucleoside triphosphate hydrolase protein n=1 Tax=Cercophora samala TaxID=330535 RepID=A0AA40DE15_9PEZI|nr:P-loop containing nucleoside triphosphate hydrolase protein [Cercophora samala]
MASLPKKEQSPSLSRILEIPYYQLPAGPNPRFVGRDAELNEIHSRLTQQTSENCAASLALCGMAGVGKTQVALHYALKHMDDYQVILWFDASDEASLEKSFSDAAFHLNIPGASLDADNQNKACFISLMSWLHYTEQRWLLIYDGAESPEVVAKFWNPSKKGSILLTSRRRVFAVQPANGGIEILPFPTDVGADYAFDIITSLQPKDPKLVTPVFAQDEFDATLELSKRLGGHPLALTQASSLAWKRGMTAKAMLEFYKEDPESFHQTTNPDLLHAGYSLPISQVFFRSPRPFTNGALLLLSIMCFLQLEGIPEDIFYFPRDANLPRVLRFLSNKREMGKYIAELVDNSLVRRSDGQLSVHRLIQIEALRYLGDEDRLTAFKVATKLLCYVFPRPQDEQFVNSNDLRTCSKYFPHVYAMRDMYLDRYGKEVEKMASARPQSKEEIVELPVSEELCILLGSASWYCVEVYEHDEVELTLNTALNIAFYTRLTETDPQYYAQLCDCASRLRQQEGDFDTALKKAQEGQRLRTGLNRGRWLSLNSLGNVYFSQGKYNVALETYQQCRASYMSEANVRRLDILHPPPPAHYALCVNKLNIGRTLTVLGRHEEAAVALNEASELNKDPLMSIRIQYHQGLLDRASGNLTKAVSGLKAAIESIKGIEPYPSMLDGACHYKIGCILLQQGKNALSYLQQSYEIHGRRASHPCEVVRVCVKLSEALSATLELNNITFAAKIRRYVLECIGRITGSAGSAAEEVVMNEEFLDSLVDGQLR